MPALHTLDATDLAAALTTGETTSVAIVEALAARAEAVDDRVGALVHRFTEGALRQAQEADEARHSGDLGALAGLPITLKECIATEGTRTTIGLVARLNAAVESNDSVITALLREAGAIVVGKTNLSVLMLYNECDNPIWGPTNNPWALDRSPGGSSGGEAAAIAAGLSPWGIGTDIGGSIRVPAAYCGIVGLKPTAGRWSTRGCMSGLPGQEAIVGAPGPMARTVRDVRWLYRTLDSPGHNALDPNVVPLQTGDPAEIDVSGLTIGVFDDDGIIAPSPAIRRGVQRAADALQARGARTLRIRPAHAQDILRTYFGAISAGALDVVKGRLGDHPAPMQLAPMMRVAGLPPFARRALTAILERLGDRRLANALGNIGIKPVAEYWRLTAQRTALRAAVLDAWAAQGLDAVICPPHATVAVGHGQSSEFSYGGSYAMRFNLLNFPAGVVPIGRVREGEEVRNAAADRFDKTAAAIEAGTAGLPVAVQVVGRPWREDMCLAVMTAIEAEVAGDPELPSTPVTPG